ncbi:MAG TPA: NAD(P)H-dependent glycerol-3-phosphate dehydrogenase [Thermoanaerobaculia bacterium]
MKDRIAILGAGSWGTALAIELSRSGHEVMLWGRDPEVAARIEADGRHPRRLTGYPIPPATRVSADLAEAFAFGSTLLVAVPCASLRPLLDLSPGGTGRGLRLVSTGKGIEPESLKRMSEILLEHYPEAAIAALSGPTFAEGVARGDPTAAVVASRDAAAVEALQASLSSPTFRLYRSDDLVGVELAGALKNVVAIAAGIVSGLGFGPNTLAALVTRGLTEIGRIVKSQGGQDRTVQGLAGVGDLMLTCTGSQSRNRFVGEQVGKGRALAEVVIEMPEVAEGARTCLAVPRLAASAAVQAPIADAVVQVLYENVPAREAVERLMTRALRPE